MPSQTLEPKPPNTKFCGISYTGVLSVAFRPDTPCYTSQILDVKEHELEWVARHPCYDISVHREYYRPHG